MSGIKRAVLWVALGTGLFTTSAGASAFPLMDYFLSMGGGPFDPRRGAEAWVREQQPTDDGEARSCASCHGTDLRQPGRHVRTGKVIGPLARSLDPQRLADVAKAEKWFLRNCRWTWGRDCTPQEKGDLARFIDSQ